MSTSSMECTAALISPQREEGFPKRCSFACFLSGGGNRADEGTSAKQKQIKSLNQKILLSGPGRLCDAMGITREQNGILLTGDELFICEGISVPEKQIAATKESILIMQRRPRDFLYRFVDIKSACLSIKWRGQE